MIEDLPLLAPNASRTAKTIARCHDRLAAQRRRRAERDQANNEARNRQPGARARAERLLVAGFCVAYLIAMAGDLLTLAARR